MLGKNSCYCFSQDLQCELTRYNVGGKEGGRRGQQLQDNSQVVPQPQLSLNPKYQLSSLNDTLHISQGHQQKVSDVTDISN